MKPFRHPTTFVSATSRGLRSLRLVAAEFLGRKGYRVVVQEEFDCDYQRIKDMIRDQLAPCDAVILLVGPAYGFEPTDWPTGLPRRSYTQLEYELAVELKKPVYRYLASSKFPVPSFDPEPDEHQRRQGEYITRLKAQDHVWYEFDSQDRLLALLEKTRFHPQVKPNLPFDSIGSLFKGRSDAIVAVRRSLLTRPAHATAVTSKQAIHGLGGVGKTRFAVEYAHRYACEYSAILYADADTPEALASNTAALASVLDLPEREEREQPKQLEAVERWLRTHAGWLLVLDNVDTVEAQAAVNSYFPKLAAGHVLVTSRLTSGWADGVSAVELDTLSLPASTEFLLERTARNPTTPTKPARQVSPTDPADAERLAEHLGGLALALEQAGAYICQHGITFADYRTRLTAAESKVLGWFDAGGMKYPKSVAVTWQASVDELHDDGRALLNLLCWLAPDPIPMALIKTEPRVPPHAPVKSREKALRQLMDYSLAKGNADGAAVAVHRLVQDVTRERLAEPARTGALKDSLWVMDAFCVGDPTDTTTWKGVYTPASSHLRLLVNRGDTVRIADPTSRLMNCLGSYSRNAADFVGAGPVLRRALSLAEARHGTGHPEVAIALNNLAGLLQATNRSPEAEAMYRRALSISTAGPVSDRRTLAVRSNNLAELLRATGRFTEAEHLYRHALEIHQTGDETDRPALAITSSNLALLLWHTNRTGEAEALFRRALAVSESVHGDEHPDVAVTLNNLAEFLRATGRPGEAEPLCRRSLASDQKSYGSDHPRIAVSLNNLGLLLRDTNRPVEAESLFRRALAIDEATYGPSHSDVARDLNNLGILLRDTGRLSEAEPMLRRVVRVVETALGSSHPTLALALNNLGELLVATGRTDEAEAVLRQALAINEACHAPDHPDFADDLVKLAGALTAASRSAEAEPLLARALRILFAYRRTAGREHPLLKQLIDMYGNFLMHHRGYSEGRAINRIQQVLGTDH